jgi:hypothetical protein
VITVPDNKAAEAQASLGAGRSAEAISNGAQANPFLGEEWRVCVRVFWLRPEDVSSH